MSNSKIMTIISHEYMLKLKSKGFIIGTFIAPVLMAAMLVLPTWIMMATEGDISKKIYVLDETGILYDDIIASDTATFAKATYTLEELKEKTQTQEIDGYIYLPSNVIEEGKVEVNSSGGGGISFIQSLKSTLRSSIRSERLKNAGIDLQTLEDAGKGIEIITKKISKEGKVEADNNEILAGIGFIFGFANYFLMLMYGGMVLRAVIDEKANRIIEVIASSVRPFDIMFGKIIGIGLAGLTQVSAWMILSSVVLMLGLSPAETTMAGVDAQQMQQAQMLFGEIPMPDISIWMILGFLFYFISGYFIFASLYAAIGSAVDQEQDAQQLQMPVTMIIIVPILFLTAMITNPESTVAVIASHVPLFSPILMPVRMFATEMPIWEIAISVVAMIATFFGIVWVAARVYRVGILMTGKKPSFKELIKWIKLAK